MWDSQTLPLSTLPFCQLSGYWEELLLKFLAPLSSGVLTEENLILG